MGGFATAADACCGGGRAEGSDAGNVFGSSAQPPFLTPTANERLSKMNILAGADQRTRPLGPADLMRRQG